MSLQEELDNLNLKMIEKFQEWEETEIELKDLQLFCTNVIFNIISIKKF